MSKPEVYLDLDGVLADFFTEYAKLAGIESGNYRDIPPAKTDPTLTKMQGTDFFNRLPKTQPADQIVAMVVKLFGHYHICSSPLRNDFENSEKWKKVWIRRELNPQPDDLIITPNKAKYAKQADGTPNILVDDRGSNISAWEAAGGIGIKYQADEDSLSVLVDGFSRARKILKGEEEHKPQELKSLDRSSGNLIAKSGDSDEHPTANVKENIQSAAHTPLNWEKNIYAENTPDGIIVYGEDIEGGFADRDGGDVAGSFNFTANLTTGKVLDLEYDDYNPDTDGYPADYIMTDIVTDILHDFKKQYGSTWDEVEHELHGGISIGESASSGSTSAGNVASVPSNGNGKQVGSLFGGSYGENITTKKKSKLIKRTK
jgi:hypothetical protein